MGNGGNTLPARAKIFPGFLTKFTIFWRVCSWLTCLLSKFTIILLSFDGISCYFAVFWWNSRLFFDHFSKFAVFSSYFTKFAVFYDLLKKFAVISSPFDKMRDCFAIFSWNLWLFCNSSTCECFADLFIKFSFILLFLQFLRFFIDFWQNWCLFSILLTKFEFLSRSFSEIFHCFASFVCGFLRFFEKIFCSFRNFLTKHAFFTMFC